MRGRLLLVQPDDDRVYQALAIHTGDDLAYHPHNGQHRFAESCGLVTVRPYSDVNYWHGLAQDLAWIVEQQIKSERTARGSTDGVAVEVRRRVERIQLKVGLGRVVQN